MRVSMALPLAAAFALAACGSSDDGEGGSADPVTLNPGQYNATIELLEFDVPGLDDSQIASMREMFASSVGEGHSYCVTADESEASAKQLAEELADGNCTFDKFEYAGNTLDADMVCKLGEGEDAPEGPVNIDGTIEEEASTMTVAMEQKVPGVPGDGVVKMTVKMDSKRTGDCEA